jgi:hypothetical protein
MRQRADAGKTSTSRGLCFSVRAKPSATSAWQSALAEQWKAGSTGIALTPCHIVRE